jgi:di/tricarboxylate transporter
MTLEILVVYAVLTAAIVLFASDRLRLDVVALLALLTLALAGILSPAEALAGFADPIVIMIAALFIVGDGLFRTGVAARIARLALRYGAGSEARTIAVLMLIVALLSGFLSSTGTVAVMLPVAMGLAADTGIPPSRLLMPVAIAALLGGLLTLIGTAPNIVVANQLAAAGHEPFGFFSFTPMGIIIVAVGTLFVALPGRRLLPDRRRPVEQGAAGTSVPELAGEYHLPDQLHRVRITAHSPLVGMRLDQTRIRDRYGTTVVDIRRPEAQPRSAAAPLLDRALPVVPETRFARGDSLVLLGSAAAVDRLVAEERLESVRDTVAGTLPADVGLVEVILTPRSRLIGSTLADIGFRTKFRVTVLGIRRLGELLGGELRRVPLRFGDTLLVKGPWRNIEAIRREHLDFLIASVPRELELAGMPRARAPLAALIVLGMLLLMTFGWVPPVHAVLLAAVAMVLTGCVRGEGAYRAVNWESVVLIAAFLPVATALQKTGGLDLIVAGLDHLLGGRGPLLILAGLFVLTSGLSQVISNTATAVLIAPIAVQIAAHAGYAPEPLLMGVAVAASTAFATPIASPVNVLVLGPGGYRFGDFFRIGVLLQLLVLGATLAVVPRLFPFQP